MVEDRFDRSHGHYFPKRDFGHLPEDIRSRNALVRTDTQLVFLTNLPIIQRAQHSKLLLTQLAEDFLNNATAQETHIRGVRDLFALGGDRDAMKVDAQPCRRDRV